EDDWRSQVAASLPSEALKAAQIFERDGGAAVDDDLRDLERRRSIRVEFFRQGNESALLEEPGFIREVLTTAARLHGQGSDAPALNVRRGVAAQEIAGPSGANYTLLLLIPGIVPNR